MRKSFTAQSVASASLWPVERYNRTVRHEWLDQNIFETIEEAQEQVTNWLWTYNNDRPNMAIGEMAPAMKLKQAA